MSFHGTTIGLAPLMAMCSVYQSGGVNMVSLSPCVCAAEGAELPYKTRGHLLKKKLIFIIVAEKALISGRAVV